MTCVQSLDQEGPLEEGMATYSSILTWRVPWIGEPGELQSIRLQRIGHQSDLAHIDCSIYLTLLLGFPCSSVGKEFACSAGDLGSIPGLGRSPGEGNGSPLQYPCLENLMERGAWWAAVHGVTKSQARLTD